MRDDPAFPRPCSFDDHAERVVVESAQDGMTIRTYIATQAMQAMLSWENTTLSKEGSETYPEAVAHHAVGYADALIAELDK